MFTKAVLRMFCFVELLCYVSEKRDKKSRVNLSMQGTGDDVITVMSYT